MKLVCQSNSHEPSVSNITIKIFKDIYVTNSTRLNSNLGSLRFEAQSLFLTYTPLNYVLRLSPSHWNVTKVINIFTQISPLGGKRSKF